jgi:hypothetical protein
MPPGNLNVHYSICVINNTARTLTNVRVTLDKLTPHILTTVPCNLKLMNDNEKPYPTSFNRNFRFSSERPTLYTLRGIPMHDFSLARYGLEEIPSWCIGVRAAQRRGPLRSIGRGAAEA